MSHLPRPTSAASTSSSSGIGTLPGGLSKIPKPGFSRENSTLKSVASDDFKVGDKVKSCKIFGSQNV